MFQTEAFAVKAHCPLLVADYLIARSGGRLTPLQVIKLTYIAHGYSLAINGKQLVDEAIEAWRYGPVVPSVYYRAKKYGGGQITHLLYSGASIDDAGNAKFFEEHIPSQDRAVLDAVLDEYGEFTGSELIGMTHGPDSPWTQYYRPRIARQKIPDSAIKAHYLEVIADVRIRHR